MQRNDAHFDAVVLDGLVEVHDIDLLQAVLQVLLREQLLLGRGASAELDKVFEQGAVDCFGGMSHENLALHVTQPASITIPPQTDRGT